MKKQLITFEQLSVLSFFRFGKLDGVDMSLIIKECKNMINVELDLECDDYFIIDDGIIILDDNYIRKFNKNVDSKLFEEIYGNFIQGYLDNIDMYKFILNKIKLLNVYFCNESDILKRFSLLQIRFLKKLYQEHYVMNDISNVDCFDIKLTKRGELYLFLDEYRDDVEKFRILLDTNGYDSGLIDDFLMSQDLSLNVREILVLENFIAFLDKYVIEYGKSRVLVNK